jgi:hypothetical protein
MMFNQKGNGEYLSYGIICEFLLSMLDILLWRNK